MAESAKGSVAGFLFQFERGLLLMTGLSSSSDYITFEEVDDIAVLGNDGTVLIADQSKHSIARSGSTYEDTSYALWRTLQLWIIKFTSGIFSNDTEFICSTNKKISEKSLLYCITTQEFSIVKEKITELQKNQKGKLKSAKKGGTIKKNLELIDFVLNNLETFRKIQPKIRIEDQIDIKENVLNKLFLNSPSLSELQRDNIYEGLIGWLVKHSLYKWKNGKIAEFKKLELDIKYQSLISAPSIRNAIFRAKESFDITSEDIDARKDEIFVKQIDYLDARTEIKERRIKNAIEDFIRCEVEHAHLINENGEFTKEDFENFLEKCHQVWQNYFDDKVKYELDTYSEKDKNEIGHRILYYVMNELEINFKNDFTLFSNNEYIKNGSFLKLSNIPRLGWHPEWEAIFKNKK